MPASRPIQERLDEFAASLVGLTYDCITVLEATAGINLWDEDRIYVELVITDPPAGREAWPLQPLHEMRMDIYRWADEAGFEQVVDVRTTGGPDDEDDEPPKPPGPSRARILTSDERSELA